MPAMTLLRMTVAGAALALIAGCSGGIGGGNTTIRLVYSSFMTENSTDAEQVMHWVESVNEELDGTEYEIDVTMHWGGSLLAGQDTLQGLKNGLVDLGYISQVYFPAELPLSQVVGVPFITDDAVAVVDTMAQFMEGDGPYREEWEGHGLVPLAWKPTANIVLGTVSPVSSIDELRGQQVRVAGFAAEAFNDIGANAVVMDGNEVYQSLDTGVLDGFTFPFANAITNFRTAEVAPYMYETGMGQFGLVAPVVISQRKFDELPEPVQQAMVEAGQSDREFVAGAMAEQDAEACEALLAVGGSVESFPEDEIQTWSEQSRPGAIAAWKQAAVRAGVSEAEVESFFADYEQAVADNASDYVDGTQACMDAS